MAIRKKLKLGDFFLIVAVFLLAIVLFLMNRPEGAAARATVSVDGQIIKQIDLPCYDSMILDHGVTIRFDGMRACIEQSDCPDKTCVKRGWLTVGGQSSVCLPNKTVLTLDGDVIMGG